MAAIGVWVEDDRWGKKLFREPSHMSPSSGSVCGLASSSQGGAPSTDDLPSEPRNGDAVGWDGVIIQPSTDNAAEPLSLFFDGGRPDAEKVLSYLSYLLVHPSCDGMP